MNYDNQPILLPGIKHFKVCFSRTMFTPVRLSRPSVKLNLTAVQAMCATKQCFHRSQRVYIDINVLCLALVYNRCLQGFCPVYM